MAEKKRKKRREPRADHDRRVLGYTGTGWLGGQFSAYFGGGYYNGSGYVTGYSGAGVDSASNGDFGAGMGDGSGGDGGSGL